MIGAAGVLASVVIATIGVVGTIATVETETGGQYFLLEVIQFIGLNSEDFVFWFLSRLLKSGYFWNKNQKPLSRSFICNYCLC
jgi:hypothetical protein